MPTMSTWTDWVTQSPLSPPVASDTVNNAPNGSNQQKRNLTRQSPPRGSRFLVWSIVAVVVLVVSMFAALTLNGKKGSDLEYTVSDRGSENQADLRPAEKAGQAGQSKQTPSGDHEFCPQTSTDSTLVTQAGGNPSTAPGVIAEFEKRIFTDRDGPSALTLTNKSPRIPKLNDLNQQIRELPEKAQWCVTVTPLRENQWHVVVLWRASPQDEGVMWVMRFFTAHHNDTYHITRIEHPEQ